ncbi:MAG TPA: RsbRD N-terminal domain-containing protein [Thermodesulfovibrionales bacterium]|nr:RsbRD N-terminal domain-containing protein [Thermodesulfovibrionales bacterium]
MTLWNFLANKKSALLKRWFDVVMEPYPAETSGLLKNQEKQFTNPVGYTISHGLEHIFDMLIDEKGADLEGMVPFLDSIVRIRAVQDLRPSQALSFVFHLRSVIREELASEAKEFCEEMAILESRIDAIALMSFDIFVKCREKVYELKANEVKNRTFRLLQMANLVSEGRKEQSD